ncbi:hypothetical protein [Rubricoccus marinus]|uniref:Uncharacterized protein n=1 Tax=Rubricoccus marinus TaxID=716817 RepID=A0A259U056_9BACT|nr:hypothetical protein [Rubricoccus marinus]OZC03361.1 hypothetical protein BSZ36_10430 [Rubricoccus marinus]
MPSPSALALEHRQRLLALQSDLRDSLSALDGASGDAPLQLRATIETAAEALGGLANAFGDFAEGDEDAWEG